MIIGGAVPSSLSLIVSVHNAVGTPHDEALAVIRDRHPDAARSQYGNLLLNLIPRRLYCRDSLRSSSVARISSSSCLILRRAVGRQTGAQGPPSQQKASGLARERSGSP
jgi:hypothetical protein